MRIPLVFSDDLDWNEDALKRHQGELDFLFVADQEGILREVEVFLIGKPVRKLLLELDSNVVHRLGPHIFNFQKGSKLFSLEYANGAGKHVVFSHLPQRKGRERNE